MIELLKTLLLTLGIVNICYYICQKINIEMRDKFIELCNNRVFHIILGFGLLALIIISQCR